MEQPWHLARRNDVRFTLRMALAAVADVRWWRCKHGCAFPDSRAHCRTTDIISAERGQVCMGRLGALSRTWPLRDFSNLFRARLGIFVSLIFIFIFFVILRLFFHAFELEFLFFLYPWFVWNDRRTDRQTKGCQINILC